MVALHQEKDLISVAIWPETVIHAVDTTLALVGFFERCTPIWFIQLRHVSTAASLSSAPARCGRSHA